MAWVCKELSNPNLITREIKCNQWEVLEQQQASILPDLSAADRDAILLWMVSIFAVVFIVKRIRRMFGG